MFKPKYLALILLLTIAAIPIYNTKAETKIWDGEVASIGGPVTSITSVVHQTYRIIATEVFSPGPGFTADAQYYTNEGYLWNWVTWLKPDGHSFLQINGADVNWGPFSNGDTFHTYTINYVGDGNPIVFNIIDWIDGNKSNNVCHLRVQIYETEMPGYTPGFWKHNIGVYLDYNNGSYSAFRDGTKLTGAMLESYAAIVGVSLQDAYDALSANGRGMDTVRRDMANAFNAAAGYGPYL
jgi:hypothetical protein